jgi:predicted phosphodiesterase
VTNVLWNISVAGLAAYWDCGLQSPPDSALPHIPRSQWYSVLADSAFLADLSFLHLSDIHFRKGRMGDVHDIDNDVRNELERDLRNVLASRVQKLDGIIVSGDIAFAGQPEEFEYGRGWIEKIAELANCSVVMMTPGNHDVDRDSIFPHVEQLHEEIRAAASLQERDAVIAGILRNPAQGQYLMGSIAAYNELADIYGCKVSPSHPYWERDFRLGNKGTLRIRGVTSTLISGPKDHAVTHRVVYGGAQRTLLRNDNVFRMLVGHHPPSWTLEGDDADRAFSDRAEIQLFGHKHEVWYQRPRGIRVIAGAVHPDRHESDWEPRYSILSIRLSEEGRLLTRVYPRRWSKEETTFIPDYNSLGHDFRDHAVQTGP